MLRAALNFGQEMGFEIKYSGVWRELKRAVKYHGNELNIVDRNMFARLVTKVTR